MFRGFFCSRASPRKNKQIRKSPLTNFANVTRFSNTNFALKMKMCAKLAVQMSPPTPSETKDQVLPPTPPEKKDLYKTGDVYLTTVLCISRTFTGLAFQCVRPTTFKAEPVPNSNAQPFTEKCFQTAVQGPPTSPLETKPRCEQHVTNQTCTRPV